MRCPTCNSPDPARHPAMQFEGEVQICPDTFHGAHAESYVIRRALEGIIDHWREFGEMTINNQTDYGFDERIEAAAKLIGKI